MNKVQRLIQLLMALTVLSLFATAAFATSIIAIKTGDDIFIGTDSKVLIEKDVAISQCKITKMNDIYLVFSGVPALPKTSFNAYEIAEKIFSGQGTIQSRLDAFDTAVKEKLQEAFEKLRTTDDKLFSRWYTDDVQNRVAMQVLVAGAEKKGTVLSMLEYRITSKKNEPVKLQLSKETFAKKTNPNKPTILFLGMQDAINVLKKKKNFLNDFDEVGKINEWISAEIAADPKKVGPPVDIIKISPKKAEWIQHKSQCPEVDETKSKTAPAKK